MGRRIVHMSRPSAGISPITLFAFVVVVVIIGYVLLGRGSQKTETTDEAAPPVEGSSSKNSSSRKSSRRHSTPQTPDPVQSDTDYPATSDTEASHSGNESDISSGNSGGQGGGRGGGRKKGILTHKRPQSERGRRGSISFIDDDKAASRLWRFDDEERPKEIWEEPVVFGGGMKPPPKDDFRVPHEQSRLRIFEAALLEGKHHDLLARMKEVESLVFTNWMAAEKPDASLGEREAWATRLATAESDSWGNTRRWGKLPTIVFDLCLALLRSKIIDISTLAEVMYEEPHIRDCWSCPAKGIIEGGFEAVDMEQGDGLQKVRRLVPKNDEAAREILIGWFALPYRAYLREQWMNCRARVEAGYRLPDSVIAALGTPSGDPGLGGEMLKWLSWAGQRYLVNRLFTLGGADLLDGTARISITRLDAGDDSLFKLDVTLFVPEATNLADFARAKAAADWMRNTKGVGKDGSAHGEGWKGSSYWLRDALHRCIHLSGSWIYANFKGQDQKVNQQEDRIALRRLFIRPGYSKTHVDMAKGRINAQGPVKEYHDQKLSVLMQLPLDAVARAAKYREAVNAVKGMVDRSRFSIIRFTNERQHSWYTPVEGATAADRFDPRQMAFMLGVMGRALGKGVYYDEFTMEDEATYAITESNVSIQTELTPGSVHLDFGGILPYVAMTTAGQMKADFVWLKDMPRVRTYYLPLMAGAPIASRGESKLVYQGMESLGKTSVQWCTARWALDRSTGIWAAMALWDDVERRTAFVVMVDSLEEGRRVLHQQLEGVFVYEVIDSLFAKGLEATEGGAIGQANRYQTSDGARRRVEIDLTRMLYIISKALQLTTIVECSTGNNHPGVYLHLYTATAAQLLAKWDALPERRSQLAPPVVPEPAETPQPLAPRRNVGFAEAEGDDDQAAPRSAGSQKGPPDVGPTPHSSTPGGSTGKVGPASKLRWTRPDVGTEEEELALAALRAQYFGLLQPKTAAELDELKRAGGVVDPREAHVQVPWAGSAIPDDVLDAAMNRPLWDKKGSDSRMMIWHQLHISCQLGEEDLTSAIQAKLGHSPPLTAADQLERKRAYQAADVNGKKALLERYRADLARRIEERGAAERVRVYMLDQAGRENDNRKDFRVAIEKNKKV